MPFQKCFLVIFTCSFGIFVRAETGSDPKVTAKATHTLQKATLFVKDSKATTVLFNLEFTDLASKTHGEYKDPKGNIAFADDSELMGSQVLNYKVHQYQLRQEAEIKVEKDKVQFSLTKDGKTQTETEDLGSTLVVSSNFSKFVFDHWSEILKGESVKLRFAVWDRLETVGFTIFKVGEELLGPRKTVKIKMKPSSLAISALVDPLFFNYSEDGKILLKQIGRVAPKFAKPNGGFTDPEEIP